jgi:hypothetical protein
MVSTCDPLVLADNLTFSLRPCKIQPHTSDASRAAPRRIDKADGTDAAFPGPSSGELCVPGACLRCSQRCHRRQHHLKQTQSSWPCLAIARSIQRWF